MALATPVPISPAEGLALLPDDLKIRFCPFQAVTPDHLPYPQNR
jgi:hypothetical protein